MLPCPLSAPHSGVLFPRAPPSIKHLNCDPFTSLPHPSELLQAGERAVRPRYQLARTVVAHLTAEYVHARGFNDPGLELSYPGYRPSAPHNGLFHAQGVCCLITKPSRLHLVLPSSWLTSLSIFASYIHKASSHEAVLLVLYP